MSLAHQSVTQSVKCAVSRVLCSNLITYRLTYCRTMHLAVFSALAPIVKPLKICMIKISATPEGVWMYLHGFRSWRMTEE